MPTPTTSSVQRMYGIDPMFIYSETAESPMEVAFTCVFDPATAPDGYSFENVRQRVAQRLPHVPLLRRKLVPVPLGLDHPRWVDDPDFDLDNHLHRTRLADNSGRLGLSDLTAEIMSNSLSPGQPPWELHVVEGLDEGRVAVIAKMHHSAIDGVSGTRIMAQLLDVTPLAETPTIPAPTWNPSPAPSAIRMLSDSLPNLLSSPTRYVRAAREIGKATVRLARHALKEGTASLSVPLGAPSHFDSPMKSSRSVAFIELPLSEVRQLKEQAGVTLNDVVLAACSGALRNYLGGHASSCVDPLVAVVPVSVRALNEGDAMGNRLSAMFVGLASNRPEPLDRLHGVAESCRSAKAQEQAVGYADLVTALSEAVPPPLARAIFRLGARAGAVRRLRPGNLVVSNVPGPKFPLYFAGMRMLGVYPIGPVIDGVALNITVQNYLDSLFVGLNACPAAVSDIDELATLVGRELGDLVMASGGTRSPLVMEADQDHVSSSTVNFGVPALV
ncbi:MAG TPA: wax ester/triacylglycerol synthase family O-acyltransferase [Acidimicrobiales bacterium]